MSKGDLLIEMFRVNYLSEEENFTPNGYHVIIPREDTRELVEKFPFVEIKKDTLFFKETIIIEGK